MDALTGCNKDGICHSDGGIMGKTNDDLDRMSYGQTNLIYPYQRPKLPYLQFLLRFESMLHDCVDDKWNGKFCENGSKKCANGLFCFYEYARETFEAFEKTDTTFGTWAEYDFHVIVLPLVKTLKKTFRKKSFGSRARHDFGFEARF